MLFTIANFHYLSCSVLAYVLFVALGVRSDALCFTCFILFLDDIFAIVVDGWDCISAIKRQKDN